VRIFCKEASWALAVGSKLSSRSLVPVIHVDGFDYIPIGTCTSDSPLWFKLSRAGIANFVTHAQTRAVVDTPSIPKQLPVTKSEIVEDDRLIKSAGANRCTLTKGLGVVGNLCSLSMRVRLEIDVALPHWVSQLGPIVCVHAFRLIQGIGGSAF